MKILLVDDEREEREGISFLIRKFRYPLEIVQASSGKKALAVLKEQKIDILFTDVKMPVMSGLELARIVRETDKEMKIIIFSAYAEFEYAKQAIEMNALRYLLKPIEIDEFRELMDDVVSSLEATRKKSRKDSLFRIFTGWKPDEEAEKNLWQETAPDENAVCRFLNMEFVDNYFKENEEFFLKTAQAHFGERTEYVALYPNEACVILWDPAVNQSRELGVRIRRFAQEAQRRARKEWILYVSPLCCSLSDLKKYSAQIDSAKSEVFGYGNRIVELDRREKPAEHYVSDIEACRAQLILSLDSRLPEIIRGQNRLLVEEILSVPQVSRLYVQNMLYTVIREMYDRMPGAGAEEVLAAAEALFQAKDAGTILEEYERIVDKILVNSRTDSNEKEIILRIKGIVEREYMKDISLNDIAEQVHLSPAYVSYLFKQESGQSLVKYMTDVKMAKACRFLEDKDMKIAQVGRACGYENPSYFNRLFKNYYGVTPKQYREQL